MKKIITSFLLLVAGFATAQPTSAVQPTESPQPAVSDSTEINSPVAIDPTATPDQLWDQASTAYINNDFHRAIKSYEQLLTQGLSSAKLYYNLGNAYFKDNQLGRAILCYRRALRLAPGNDDIRYNLSVAEARTKDTIEQIPEFFLSEWLRAVRHTMSCTAWSLLSLGMLTIALVSVLLFLLAQQLTWRKVGFYGALATGLLFVITTIFAAGERREMLDRTQAVVLSNSAAVKSSPDKSSADLFVLHEGTLVRITDQLDDWYEISIADGKKGWLDSRKIEII